MTISKLAIDSSLKKCSSIHYWVTALLILGLVPLLKRLNLPVNFNWAVLGAFYLLLSMQAIFLAVLLCVLGFEPKKTFGPTLHRFKDEKLRILPVITFLLVLCMVLPWRIALVLTVDTVALLEFFHRIPSGTGKIAVRSVMLPALYLLIGWVLVFAYNDIIVSARFFAAKDASFNSIDMWLLRGVSVSQICHWAVRTFPISFFRFLEIIYLGMFPLLGAGLILVSICDGTRQGLKFVGTVILPSYIALVLFYFWTSQGPYYLCPTHFTDFPSTLRTYALQRGSIDHARARWEHVPLESPFYGLLHRVSLRAHLRSARSDMVLEAVEADTGLLAHIRRAIDCFHNIAGMALRSGCARRDTNNGTFDLNDQLLRPVDHGARLPLE